MPNPLPSLGSSNPFGGGTSPAGGGSITGPFKPNLRDPARTSGIRGIMRTMRRDNRRTARR